MNDIKNSGNSQIDLLEDEINAKAKEIYTESLSMSIGEVANMYKENELELQPEYQRFFRWSNMQKTKFIESILLGIPIPPFFMYQKQDGVLAVIDGLQRLSTILQFMDILEIKDDREEIEEFKLFGTDFLPSLSGKTWNGSNSITTQRKLIFKRARIDIRIIKYSSDVDAQYELFQRLNTGGSSLTEQEVRNSLMIMENNEFFNKFESASKNIDFKECLPLSKRSIDEKEDMEYALRYLVYRNIDIDKDIKGNEDIGEFLNDQMFKLLRDSEYNIDYEIELFKKVFNNLNEVLADDSFKKFDVLKNKFVGPVSISLYEAIVPGFSSYLEKNEGYIDKEVLRDKLIKISSDSQYEEKKIAHRPIQRLKQLLKFSEEYFNDEC
ncbi:DUF262 domain-containing protein [Macrococcoides caseolyticum]|uniref:DUF262 domain-containing protein n=1 Tax=Macrococcoides caseolyticum TaxID=69966 RepID=UPI001061371F|nr:DUF262 domain-containing protein [Macrococcus caseolyticus]TDM17091.1 DUF262 domain-containing protein [Macrococcus caseolyticus]